MTDPIYDRGSGSFVGRPGGGAPLVRCHCLSFSAIARSGVSRPLDYSHWPSPRCTDCGEQEARFPPSASSGTRREPELHCGLAARSGHPAPSHTKSGSTLLEITARLHFAVCWVEVDRVSKGAVPESSICC